jgi:hypothetical protein
MKDETQPMTSTSTSRLYSRIIRVDNSAKSGFFDDMANPSLHGCNLHGFATDRTKISKSTG